MVYSNFRAERLTKMQMVSDSMRQAYDSHATALITPMIGNDAITKNKPRHPDLDEP
ncbi:hypothetical protein GCM10009304_08950 [Pseudomonas matsuisoli]|uniref:Uncharacterized protein n=1 Tax=Pseudomonas matsuisoli TaxID=1515666 RepID=A0A917PNP9_9PSED|nr:hypothetical protein GCM10009304_08950 [Pseudomonas matsuisoli]